MPAAMFLRPDFPARELRCLAKQSRDNSQSRRLLSLAAVLDGMSRNDAAGVGGMDRQTLRDWVHRFNKAGPDRPLDAWTSGARPRACHQARRPTSWLSSKPAAAGRRTLSAHLAVLPEETPLEIWFQDEARTGQKNGLVRQWARRGSRPRQPADQRHENAYLFGAICPARGTGAALALPYADTDAMQLHLDEISRHVTRSAHAVLLLDRAGWHTTAKLVRPASIIPIFLPLRAPELKPVEIVWRYLRANWLSNHVFEIYEVIVETACEAWQKLTDQPHTITSIGMRDRAHVGQTR